MFATTSPIMRLIPCKVVEVVERWRKTASLAIALLVLSVPLPWLTVTLNLSQIERGAQQYSILGVDTKVLPPTVSNSVFVSTPYFAGLLDVPYFALSAAIAHPRVGFERDLGLDSEIKLSDTCCRFGTHCGLVLDR